MYGSNRMRTVTCSPVCRCCWYLWFTQAWPLTSLSYHVSRFSDQAAGNGVIVSIRRALSTNQKHLEHLAIKYWYIWEFTYCSPIAVAGIWSRVFRSRILVAFCLLRGLFEKKLQIRRYFEKLSYQMKSKCPYSLKFRRFSPENFTVNLQRLCFTILV